MEQNYYEEVKIQLTLDESILEDKKDSVNYLLNYAVSNMLNVSTLKINYSFHLDYIGEINKRFEALLDICENPDVVIDVDLHHSELLLEKLLERVREIRMLCGLRK